MREWIPILSMYSFIPSIPTKEISFQVRSARSWNCCKQAKQENNWSSWTPPTSNLQHSPVPMGRCWWGQIDFSLALKPELCFSQAKHKRLIQPQESTRQAILTWPSTKMLDLWMSPAIHCPLIPKIASSRRFSENPPSHASSCPNCPCKIRPKWLSSVALKGCTSIWAWGTS